MEQIMPAHGRTVAPEKDAEVDVSATTFPPLPESEWTDAARKVFAFWDEPEAYEKGSISNMVMVLAHHPALAMAYYTFGRHLLTASTLPRRTRELVVLRVAWRQQAAYEWHYHVGYALNAGLTLEQIAAIRVVPPGEGWDDHDLTVLRAVDEMLGTSGLTAETRSMLARHFGRRQIMDLVFTIGNYQLLSGAVAALGIELEDHIDPIGFDLRTRSGAVPVPHVSSDGFEARMEMVPGAGA